MKLKEYVKLEAVMRLKSGLHIGTGEEPGRGEPLSVMKSVFNKLPYIPGSSIKGKMRHLLEITYDRITPRGTSGLPCGCGKCQVCLLFGSSNSATTFEPSRLIFRDCRPNEKSAVLLEKVGLENKPGVSIDRLSGKALKGAMFPAERIPEGTEFNLEISCRIFDKDNKESIKKWLAMGLYLVEQDALGGGGTRGSGNVEFEGIEFDGKKFNDKWREECTQDKAKLFEQATIKQNP